MTDDTAEISFYEELDLIREAAQILAKRFSMIADPLLESTAVFWAVIHEDRNTDWPQPVRNSVTEVVAELSRDGGMVDYVAQVDSFEADALIGRILDLRKKMQSVGAEELV